MSVIFVSIIIKYQKLNLWKLLKIMMKKIRLLFLNVQNPVRRYASRVLKTGALVKKLRPERHKEDLLHYREADHQNTHQPSATTKSKWPLFRARRWHLATFQKVKRGRKASGPSSTWQTPSLQGSWVSSSRSPTFSPWMTVLTLNFSCVRPPG